MIKEAGTVSGSQQRLNLYVFNKQSQNYTPNKLFLEIIEKRLSSTGAAPYILLTGNQKAAHFNQHKTKEPAFIQLYEENSLKLPRNIYLYICIGVCMHIGRQQRTLKTRSSIKENGTRSES